MNLLKIIKTYLITSAASLGGLWIICEYHLDPDNTGLESVLWVWYWFHIVVSVLSIAAVSVDKGKKLLENKGALVCKILQGRLWLGFTFSVFEALGLAYVGFDYTALIFIFLTFILTICINERLNERSQILKISEEAKQDED